MKLRIGTIALCVILTSSFLLSLVPRTSTGAPDTWTFIIYLNADNDLEDHGIADFLEMSSVDTASNLNIVVQFDRYGGGAYPDDTSYGNWTGAKRFVVTNGMEPTASNAIMDLGEVDSADWHVLADFVNWTITNYPADHYFLDMWDHGGDWYGVTWDYSQGTMMKLSNFTSALMDLQAYRPSLKFDVIAFDECGMASIEVAHELGGYSDYLLASEIRVPDDGFNYTSIQAVVDTPSILTTDLTARFEADYAAYYYSLLGTPKDYMLNGSFTLSTIDLDVVAPVVTAIDSLSTELLANLGAWYDQIYGARNLTEDYAGYRWHDVVDIYHLSEQLGPALSFSPQVQTLLSSVMDAFNASVVSEVHGTNPANSYDPVNHTFGMSIYFPGVDAYFDESYLSIGDKFQTSAHWDEFLGAARIGRPVVAAWTPVGDTVPIDTVIDAWISEPVIPNPSSIRLYPTGEYGNFVQCDFSYNSTEYRLEIRPKSLLHPGVNYTVQVTVMDFQGNVGNFSWQFTTEAAIPEFQTAIVPILVILAMVLGAKTVVSRRRC